MFSIPGRTQQFALFVFTGFLQLFKRRNRANRVHKITLTKCCFAQFDHERPDRITTTGTRFVSVCTVECEVGLIQFANVVTVGNKQLPTLFHVRFGFFRFALRPEAHRHVDG